MRAVDLGAVADVEDVDGAGGLVDPVDDPGWRDLLAWSVYMSPDVDAWASMLSEESASAFRGLLRISAGACRHMR